MQRLISWSKVTQVIYNKAKIRAQSCQIPNPQSFCCTILPLCLNRNHFTRRKWLIKYKATERTVVYIKIYKLTVWIINSVFRTLIWYLYFFYITNYLNRIIKETTAISPKTQRFHKIYLKCGYLSSILYIFSIIGK